MSRAGRTGHICVERGRSVCYMVSVPKKMLFELDSEEAKTQLGEETTDGEGIQATGRDSLQQQSGAGGRKRRKRVQGWGR